MSPEVNTSDDVLDREEMTRDSVARVTVDTLQSGEHTHHLEPDEQFEIASDGPVSVTIESTKEPATVERPPGEQDGESDE